MNEGRHITRASVALVLLLLDFAAQPVRATDERLVRRLDPATAQAVGRIVDDARAAGLPADPLVATALEGSSRRASPARIVNAVRRQLGELERARAALGSGAGEAEIVAGAAALRAGVPADTIARLRGLRPDQPLVVPLVVVADLVTRGVPVTTASASIVSALCAGLGDAELLRLREQVALDIRGGASPGRAVVLRAQDLGLALDGQPRAPAAERTAPMRTRAP
ncbi:MAG TPA: hypothetical protein VMS88_04910 [Terriglobales bacterium]|nr:hypothetical protein [Terriglobales bacterium]